MAGRVILGVSLAVGLLSAPLVQSAQRTSPASSQRSGSSASADVSAVAGPVFAEYCVTCHNQNTKMSGLALDSLNTKNIGENTAVWENILRRLRARRDPSAGRARPDEGTYQSLISK